MLKLWRQEKSAGPTSHEELFLDRYALVYTWALHLTQDRQQAEELTQDAFLDFAHSKPNLSKIENFDAFLYQSVRNLHRSQLYRHLRRKQLLASAFEYDCIGTGLFATDQGHLLEVWNELRQICKFLCERKESSKQGSLFLLRFFHQYMLSEVAVVARLSPNAIGRRLSAIREEIRLHLETPSKPLSADGAAISCSAESRACLGAPNSSEAFLRELQQMIFESCKGACYSVTQIERLYTVAPASSLDAPALAHIVSCARCLDIVNLVLGLPTLKKRSHDSAGEKPPADDDASFGSSGRTGRPAPKPTAGQVTEWRRRVRSIREHEPHKLIMLVDGIPRAWMPVQPGHNEIDLSLEASAPPPSFLEVLSEQDVRLLSLSIQSPPMQGGLEQQHEVLLSEGRRLALCVRFETLGPTVHISYDHRAIQIIGDENEPAQEAPLASEGAFRIVPLATTSVWQRSFGLFTWRGWSVSAAMILIASLILYQSEFSTASAGTLLANSAKWESSAVRSEEQVIHQAFALEERDRVNQKVISHRRVEVWRNPKRSRKLSRVYDEGGVLLASSPELIPSALTASNVWQFEPESTNFQRVIASINGAQVAASADRYEINTSAASLTLDKSSYRPIAETIILGQREFHFEETAVGILLERDTPLSAAVRPRNVPLPHPDASGVRVVPTSAQLDQAELRARFALHQIGADRGEQITIEATPLEVRIDALLDAPQRKQQLQAALAGIPWLDIRVRSVDELSSVIAQPRESTTVTAIEPNPSLRPLLFDRLVNQLGDTEVAVNLSRAVVAESKSMLVEGAALEQLAERFPATRLAHLSPGDRLLYDRLINEDLAEISRHCQSQQDLLEPVIATVPSHNSDSLSPTTPKIDTLPLQDRVFAITERARRISKIAFALFAYTNSRPDGTPESLAADLRSEQPMLASETARLRQEISSRLEVKETIAGRH